MGRRKAPTVASPATLPRILLGNRPDALGGLHPADLVPRSRDFATIEALQAADDRDRAGEVLATAVTELEKAASTPGERPARSVRA